MQITEDESVPELHHLVERQDVREHGEEPGDGVEVGHKAQIGQVVAQLRVVKRGDRLEEAEVLLDQGRVVLLEESIQVLLHEQMETRKGLRLVVEVEYDERRGQRVETLPIDFAVRFVVGQPGLQYPRQLAMSFGRGQHFIVLVAPWYVHRYLSIGDRLANLVDRLVHQPIGPGDVEQRRPYHRTIHWADVHLRFHDQTIAIVWGG